MAAEAAGELTAAQKKELKFERKQAKVRAAAEAAGQPYVKPSKEAKQATVDKMGKRKKRKLEELAKSGQIPEQPAANGAAATPAKPSMDTAPAEPAVLGMAEDQPADAQAKAEKKAKKAAKKAKKASEPLSASPPVTEATTKDSQPKKKKTKSSKLDATSTEQPDQPEATPATKASKKAKSGLKGKITVHQEAVLASVGDQELAKSGKAIQKLLYREHPDVTAMSAEEVAKHRADRDTAVTGADLRPVLQFDQAGISQVPLCLCFRSCCKHYSLYHIQADCDIYT